MNCRNYLHLAVMLLTALLFSITASSAWAELITFEVHGHMIDAAPPDFDVGDKFIATYTFDPNVPPNSVMFHEFDAEYDAVTDWHLSFEKGYSFEPKQSPFVSGVYGSIDIGNNNTFDGMPADNYSVTLTSVASTAVQVPSGRRIDHFTVGIRDTTPQPAPDMLIDDSIQRVPPSLDLSTSPFGVIQYSDANLSPDHANFALDSITVVPEPSTAILAIFWFGVLAAIWLCTPVHKIAVRLQ